MEIINATDGYKLGHHRMYPEGTEQVYSNWTPRSNKYFPEATEGSVVFGIQYLIKEYLIKQFEKNFFNLPKKEAVEMFYRRVNNFVGIESVGYRHIEALYDLGYLPIRIKALPEGSVCPIRVPMMTITNTLPEFFWLTNYLETIISCTLWMPCTSATRARLYKKELHCHACKTGFPTDVNLGFCCHDFSMRGMAGMEAAIISGMGRRTDMEVTILTMVIQSSKRKEIQRLEELSPLKQRSLRIATILHLCSLMTCVMPEELSQESLRFSKRDIQIASLS